MRNFTPVELFYIHGHTDKSPEELAKAIGCKPKDMRAYLNRGGASRSKDERQALQEGKTPPATPIQEQKVEEFTVPNKGEASMQLHGVRKHGDSGAVINTSASSMMTDEITKSGPKKQYDESYVFIMNKDKELDKR